MSTDVFSFTQKDTRVLSFMSQSIGLMAELDLGTEHLRFMGDTYVSPVLQPYRLIISCFTTADSYMATSAASSNDAAAPSKSTSKSPSQTSRRWSPTYVPRANKPSGANVVLPATQASRSSSDQRESRRLVCHRCSIEMRHHRATGGSRSTSRCCICMRARGHSWDGISCSSRFRSRMMGLSMWSSKNE